MDTIARVSAGEVGPLLRELGYAGLGGKALDVAMPAGLAAHGLPPVSGPELGHLGVRLGIPV